MNAFRNLPELARGWREALHSTIRTRSGLVMVLLGAGALVAGCLALAAGVEYFLRSGGVPTSEVFSSKPAAEISLPTQECPLESLKLGERVFAVQVVSISPDGLLPTPPTEVDLAYRVEGAVERRIFLLGMEAFGGDLAVPGTLTQATYTDGNCGSVVSQLSTAQSAQVSGTSAASLVQAELVVLIQTGADGSGVALYGGTIAEEINQLSAPTPEESAVQAEIGVLEVKPSEVGQIIQVKVSIYNYGSQGLELISDAVSLLVEGGKALGPLSAKPALPETIQPGETLEIEIIFPRPSQGLGTLRIFTAEYELANWVE